ncbi:hypothetical protein A7L51_19585 [Acinetobacter baumannii]|nr:hypothetical protein A7L51_19585 [Acinetobacter baumannii]
MKTVKRKRLTTETVESAALSLESVDNVERSDSLALGVLSVGDGVTNDTLEEGLENTTGLLVNHG